MGTGVCRACRSRYRTWAVLPPEQQAAGRPSPTGADTWPQVKGENEILQSGVSERATSFVTLIIPETPRCRGHGHGVGQANTGGSPGIRVAAPLTLEGPALSLRPGDQDDLEQDSPLEDSGVNKP